MLLPPQGRNFHCPHVDQLCFHQSSKHFSSKVVTLQSTRDKSLNRFETSPKKQGLPNNEGHPKNRKRHPRKETEIYILNQISSPVLAHKTRDINKCTSDWGSVYKKKFFEVFQFLACAIWQVGIKLSVCQHCT